LPFCRRVRPPPPHNWRFSRIIADVRVAKNSELSSLAHFFFRQYVSSDIVPPLAVFLFLLLWLSPFLFLSMQRCSRARARSVPPSPFFLSGPPYVFRDFLREFHVYLPPSAGIGSSSSPRVVFRSALSLDGLVA